MNVEPQIDPPVEMSSVVDGVEFHRMLQLGTPIRLRESAAGRWLIYANEYNELHVGDREHRELGRVAILAALAVVCAQFDTTRPGFNEVT